MYVQTHEKDEMQCLKRKRKDKQRKEKKSIAKERKEKGKKWWMRHKMPRSIMWNQMSYSKKIKSRKMHKVNCKPRRLSVEYTKL